MSWLGNITHLFSKATQRSEPPFLETGPISSLDDRVLNTVDLSLRTVWDYAAIKVIATNAKSVPITPSIYNPKTKVMEPISRQDPLFKLVEQPNSYMVWDEFLEACIWYLSVFGDVPIHKAMVDGAVTAYYPMRSDKVNVITSTDKLIDRYEFEQSPGKTLKFTPEEVFMIKHFDPLNAVRGMPDNQAARQSLLADWHANNFNVVFFGNHAMPGVILKTDKPLNLTQRRRLRASWRSAFSGSSKAHGMAILTSGLTVESIVPTHRDMQFGELMRESMTRILAARGVPPGVLGMTSGLTFSNLAEQRHLFLVNTLRPTVNMILDRLNKEIFSPIGINLEADYEGVLTSSQTIHDRKMEVRGIWRDGLITRNQALEKLGFPLLATPKGEEFFPIQASQQPSGSGDSLSRRDGNLETEITDRNSDANPQLISNNPSATIKSAEDYQFGIPQQLDFVPLNKG